MLPLIVRRSPLRSRTLEWSPAEAISRTCSTTLMTAAAGGHGKEKRGREGTENRPGEDSEGTRKGPGPPPPLQNGAVAGPSHDAASAAALTGARRGSPRAGPRPPDSSARAAPPSLSRLRGGQGTGRGRFASDWALCRRGLEEDFPSSVVFCVKRFRFCLCRALKPSRFSLKTEFSPQTSLAVGCGS